MSQGKLRLEVSTWMPSTASLSDGSANLWLSRAQLEMVLAMDDELRAEAKRVLEELAASEAKAAEQREEWDRARTGKPIVSFAPFDGLLKECYGGKP